MKISRGKFAQFTCVAAGSSTMRRFGKCREMLHGIPIALKVRIDTTGAHSTREGASFAGRAPDTPAPPMHFSI
jgi:hypothetical protein